MVAVIKAGHSMHRIFNYNENKVKEGVAECIGVENFPLNAEEMSLKIKLNYLLKRMEVNENVKQTAYIFRSILTPQKRIYPKKNYWRLRESICKN